MHFPCSASARPDQAPAVDARTFISNTIVSARLGYLSSARPPASWPRFRLGPFAHPFSLIASGRAVYLPSCSNGSSQAGALKLLAIGWLASERLGAPRTVIRRPNGARILPGDQRQVASQRPEQVSEVPVNGQNQQTTLALASLPVEHVAHRKQNLSIKAGARRASVYLPLSQWHHFRY